MTPWLINSASYVKGMRVKKNREMITGAMLRKLRENSFLPDRKLCGRWPRLCQRYGYSIRRTARQEHWQRVMLQKPIACFSQNFQQRRPGFCLPATVFLCREGHLFTVISCENVDRNYVYLGSVTKYCDTA